MPEQLSNKAQQKIQRIVDDMIQGGALEEAAGEELRGHLEDKTLAYLTGQQALSEPDALLLAREHLGNASLVRAQLCEVHQPLPVAGLGGRLLSLFMLMFALQIPVYFLSLFVTVYVPWGRLLEPLVILPSLGLLYLLLRRAREAEGSVRPPWYGRLRPYQMGFLTVVLFVAPAFARLLADALPGELHSATPFPSYPLWMLLMTSLLVGWSVPIFTIFIALWWCGIPKTHFRAGVAVTGAVFGVQWLQTIASNVVVHLTLSGGVDGSVWELSNGLYWITMLPVLLAGLVLYRFLGPRDTIVQVA